MENRSKKIAVSVPSQKLEANAFVTIQYGSIETQVMEEHNGAHNPKSMNRLRIIHWQLRRQQKLP